MASELRLSGAIAVRPELGALGSSGSARQTSGSGNNNKNEKKAGDSGSIFRATAKP